MRAVIDYPDFAEKLFVEVKENIKAKPPRFLRSD
jgi:hypothetical protein